MGTRFHLSNKALCGIEPRDPGFNPQHWKKKKKKGGGVRGGDKGKLRTVLSRKDTEKTCLAPTMASRKKAVQVKLKVKVSNLPSLFTGTTLPTKM